MKGRLLASVALLVGWAAVMATPVAAAPAGPALSHQPACPGAMRPIPKAARGWRAGRRG